MKLILDQTDICPPFVDGERNPLNATFPMFSDMAQKAIRLVGIATIQFGGHSREIKPPREIPEPPTDTEKAIAIGEAITKMSRDIPPGDEADSEHPTDYGGFD